MVTISSILGSWLVGKQDHLQGVDIFRRVCKDAALLSLFRKFATDYTKERLKQEIEKLYGQSKTTPAHENEVVTLESLKEDIFMWLDDDRNYFEGVNILCSSSNDPLLKDFFMHHFSDHGDKLLYAEMKKLHDKMEVAAALKNTKPAAPVTAVDRIRAWLNGDRNYIRGVDLFEKSIDRDDSKRKYLLSIFRMNDNERSRQMLYDEMDTLLSDLLSKQRIQQGAPALIPLTGENTSVEGSGSSPIKSKPDQDGEQPDDPDNTSQTGTDDHTGLSAEDESIPDSQLKLSINNLRKSLSKHRMKEQTPERVVMIRDQEVRLEALQQRWNNLIPVS